jgi:hypothetical protein
VAGKKVFRFKKESKKIMCEVLCLGIMCVLFSSRQSFVGVLMRFYGFCFIFWKIVFFFVELSKKLIIKIQGLVRGGGGGILLEMLMICGGGGK